jgi:hypothetical protein
VAARPEVDARPAVAARLETAVLLLLCVTAWMLSHRYLGLFHDAGLYTLQALARLHPSSLNQDVFLHLGSQDEFTVFSPLYAGTGSWLGIESAAAALTFVFQMALFAAAWTLARAVMPARLALYGLAVFIAIPGDYGADRIFTNVEQFLTPRMAAEALVLAGLAAALSARTWAALALLALAALLHPLMAAAGLAAAGMMALPRGNLKRLMPMGAAAALIAATLLLAATLLMPDTLWGRFDQTWLTLVSNRSPYLFVKNWQWDDWARVAVAAATLAAGLAASGGRARTLCMTALLTTLAGMALSFLAGDELHLVLFTQLQPWRWQWLGTVTAALVLPLILSLHWRQGVGGRSTAVLLACAWIFSSNVFALAAAFAALGSLAWGPRLKAGEARLVFWGACGMLAIAILWRLASNLEFTDAHYLDPNIALGLRRAISFARDGTAMMALLYLIGLLHRASPRNGLAAMGLAVLGLTALAGTAALLPQTWTTWTHREFPPPRIAQFAAWRERMAPGSNVFWPESPLGSWVLLDRPSYLSVLQTSGMVFSRNAAIELQRRALALASFVPQQSFLAWGSGGANLSLTPAQLRGVCGLAVFDYLVTTADLGLASLDAAPAATSPANKPLHLYRCAGPAG